ncbi:MAG: hypothetical protein ABIP21_00050 [Acidimicrobiia bacterium]
MDVDVYSLVLQPNDRVMLCSDGLTSMVRSNGIAQILRSEPDPTAAANALVDAANEAGGDDNITVLVLDARADGVDPLPRSVAAAIGVTGGDAETVASAADPTSGEVVPTAAVSVVTQTTSRDTTAAAPTAATEPDAAALPRDTAGYRPRVSRRGRGRRAGRGIGRLLLFAVPILVILAVAIGAIGWYARNSYFIAFDAKGRVALYQGRPGGILFWDPKLETTTALRAKDLTAIGRRAVRAQRDDFNKLTDAKSFVKRETTTTTVTTTPSTTSTTLAAGTPPGASPTAPTTPSPT